MTDRRAAIKKLAMGLAGGRLAYGSSFAARAQLPPAASVPPASSGSIAPGAQQPFDFAWLKGQAHWLASNGFQPSKDVLPPAMGKLGYDQYQSIRFRSDHALWADAGLEFRRAVLPRRPQLHRAGAPVRGHRRPSPRNPLRPRDVRVGQERPRPVRHEGSRGVCGFSCAVRHRLERRCGGIPRRELFSRGRRRYAAIRPVRARPRGRYGVSAAGGVSALHLILVRAPGQGGRHIDAVRACSTRRASPARCAFRSRPAAPRS